MVTLIFIKLILAHLIGDFFLQTKKTVEDKRLKKAGSLHLYGHGLTHGVVAMLLLFDWQLWWVGLYFFIVHTLIDVFKLYLDKTGKWYWFILDQVLHVLSIALVCCWMNDWSILQEFELSISSQSLFTIITAYVFVTWPAAYLMGEILKSFHFKRVNDESLNKAGRAIGILERILTLTFILIGQYEAIGFLIAAKSLLRFREGAGPDEPRIQTEYLIIGTLMSFLVALLVGLVVKSLVVA